MIVAGVVHSLRVESLPVARTRMCHSVLPSMSFRLRAVAVECFWAAFLKLADLAYWTSYPVEPEVGSQLTRTSGGEDLATLRSSGTSSLGRLSAEVVAYLVFGVRREVGELGSRSRRRDGGLSAAIGQRLDGDLVALGTSNWMPCDPQHARGRLADSRQTGPGGRCVAVVVEEPCGGRSSNDQNSDEDRSPRLWLRPPSSTLGSCRARLGRPRGATHPSTTSRSRTGHR